MTDDELRRFIREIVRFMEDETGTKAYEPSFAGGDSGLSYGRMQHDVASTRERRDRFEAILRAGGVTGDELESFMDRASKKGVSRDDFSQQERTRMTEALNQPKAKAMVDQDDAAREPQVINFTMQVVEAAKQNPNGAGSFDPKHRDFKKTIGLTAAWMNRSNGPTKILDFVKGKPVELNEGRSSAHLPEGTAPTFEALTQRYFPATLQFAPKEKGGNGDSIKLWNERLDRGLKRVGGQENSDASPSNQPIAAKTQPTDERLAKLASFATEPEDETDEILLKRPSTWTGDELKAVMRHRDYWGTKNRGRELVQKSSAWHDNFYGTDPVQWDAAGRMIRPQLKRQPPRQPMAAMDASGGDLVSGVQRVVSNLAQTARRVDWTQATRNLQTGLNNLALSAAASSNPDPTSRIWSQPMKIDGHFGPKTRRTLKQTVSALGSQRVLGLLA